MADIDALRPALRARCEALTGPDEELCRAQTAAAEMVRVAALEESFRRTPEAAKETQRARIEARYQVARAKCAALGGSQRDSCMISVHATKGRSLLEAQAPYLLRQPE
ncbi:MAG TPA: hypothetical protein VN878_09420 [Usitatibacter sp.]|nr:hypothetical protein [Usitatibacter sp.]